MGVTATGDESDSGTIERGWGAQLAWVLAAGLLGFVEAAVFSGLLRVPRPWFLVPYVAVSGAFVVAYFRWSGIGLADEFRRRWVWGLVGAAVVGALMVVAVLGQPASPAPQGAGLVFALVWLGLVYGVVDAMLLSVLPVLAVWSACASLGLTRNWPGRILAGGAALLGSLFVTAAYHLGYAEYRGPELVSPLIGNSTFTLGYLLTFNPLTAVGAHAIMHVASVLHGIDTTVTLPPHH